MLLQPVSSDRLRSSHDVLPLIETPTDAKSELHYAIAIDCGSSGSRVFVYTWPRQSNVADLLHIKELRDESLRPVVMKIQPGLSSLSGKEMENATEYIKPLLDYAALHIPRAKHKETPLFILATAGMRMLPKLHQDLIFTNLRSNVRKKYEFVYSDQNFEVISGKEEGVFQWVAANYMLGKFNDITEGDDPLVVVQNPSKSVGQKEHTVRKRTVGIIDMGGGSLQIAFEVTKNNEWQTLQNRPNSKKLIAELNLGCKDSDLKHIYRLYVTTFLGYGSNAMVNRYYRSLLKPYHTTNATLDLTGTKRHPIKDPCLSADGDYTFKTELYHLPVHFQGTGNFSICVQNLIPFFHPNPNVPQDLSYSINGSYQPQINFYNSEFYGFSEFFYSGYDILGLKGHYGSKTFSEAAKDYCQTAWKTSLSRHSRGLYPKADSYRLRTQCFKSAYMYAVLHLGLKFPKSYSSLINVQLIKDKEIHWTLGALLYRMRYYPLGEFQSHHSQGEISGKLKRSRWFFFDDAFPYSQHLLIFLILIVIVVILYLMKRLRRWFFKPSSFVLIGVDAISLDCPSGVRLRKSSESSHINILMDP